MIDLIDLFPTFVSLLNLNLGAIRSCLLGTDISTTLESDVQKLIPIKDYSIASYPRCTMD